MYEELVGTNVKVHTQVGGKTYTYGGKVLSVNEEVICVADRDEDHYISIKTIIHLVRKVRE